MGKHVSVNSIPLNGEDPAFPCGEIAVNYFNDSYQIFRDSNQPILINEKNIAWVETHKFSNPPNYKNISWIDITDGSDYEIFIQEEHFIVWVTTSRQSRKNRIWGSINTTIPKGNYRLNVSKSLIIIILIEDFNVTEFEGTTSVILTTTSIFG